MLVRCVFINYLHYCIPENISILGAGIPNTRINLELIEYSDIGHAAICKVFQTGFWDSLPLLARARGACCLPVDIQIFPRHPVEPV